MPYYPQGTKKPSRKPPLKKQPLFRLALICLSALLIIYGAVRLVVYGADWIASRRTAQELRKIAAAQDTAIPKQETVPEAAPEMVVSRNTVPVPDPTAVPAAAPSEILPAVEYPGGLQVSARIRKLREKSEYIIGWLTMDDCDEPVALKDNDFFLNHDASGNRNVNGSLFLDESTRLLTRPYTLMVFGHNMKTGAMFGNLHRYEQTIYCNRHRIITFDTLYEEGKYAIFAVATIHVTPGTAGYLSLTDLQSTRRAARKKALAALSSLSVYSSILDVNEEDQLLLLITCVGDDDQRLVVAARRLRDDETPDRLTLTNGGKS